MLLNSAWEDVEIVSPPRYRKQPWLVRAKPPASLVGMVGAVHVEDDLLVLQRAVQKSPKSTTSSRLDMASRPAAHEQVVIKPMDVRTVAVTQNDDEVAEDAEMQDVKEATQASSAGGASKRASSPRTAAAAAAASTTKRPALGLSPDAKRKLNSEFEILDTLSDGSCGYSSLAVGAALMRGDRVEHTKEFYTTLATTLRTQIAQHIAAHADEYRPDWAAELAPTAGADDGPHPSTWEAWLQSLYRPRRWICQLSLKAGAKRLGVKVVVLQKQMDGSWAEPIIMGKSRKKEYPIILGFSEAEKHYVLLVPKRGGDSIPQAWRTGGSHDGVSLSQESLRGSGKRACLPETSRGNKTLKWLPQGTPASSTASSVAGSRVSSKTLVEKKGWLPDRTPSMSSKTVASLASRVSAGGLKSMKRWLPSKTPGVSKRFSSACSNTGSLHSDVSADSAASKVASAQVATPTDHVWTCKRCQVRFEAKTGKKLSDLRHAHLDARHPGWEKGTDLIRKLVDVVKTSKSLPLQQCDWICVWCREGLPPLNRWQFEKSVTAHLKERHPKRKKKSAAESNRARGKAYRKDKDSVPKYRDGKITLAMKLRDRANKARNWNPAGHELKLVENVDWSSWHGSTAWKRGTDTLLTCVRCLSVRRASCKWSPCSGDRTLTPAQAVMWSKLSDHNKAALREVWGMTQAQVEVALSHGVTVMRDPAATNGHDFKEVPINWKYWPRTQAKRKPSGTLWTCMKCWVVRRGLGCSTIQCRGKGSKAHALQTAFWQGLKSAHVKNRICSVWGVSVAEANAWFS